MIYLAADTHGMHDIQKVITFCNENNVTKDDYLIILGDIGVCFFNNARDEQVKEIFRQLPPTILFIDGNHENFDLLDQYPIDTWNGGKVHFIKKDIIHLMRGQVFTIENKTFFTFGGGNSIDQMQRTPHISWWPQEIPTYQEFQEGLDNLQDHHNQVDYILTHTVPGDIISHLVTRIIPGEETMHHYFDTINAIISFKKWYFGHWHIDIHIEDKYIGLWNIVTLLEE